MTISPTLGINQEIERRQAAGEPVVPLGFGEANIPVHPALIARLHANATEAGYGPVEGLYELRRAAADYWNRRSVPTEPEQVIAAPGSKPLLFGIFEALGGPVLLPKPSWVSYVAQNGILRQESHLVPISPGSGGAPDPAQLREAAKSLHDAGNPATSVLVTLPDNPTGTIAAPGVIREICDIAEEFDLTIISDEIYLDLVHDEDQEIVTPSMLSPERTVTTTGLSKNLALGGWRLGVARFGTRLQHQGVVGRVATVASEVWSAAPQPVQHAAVWAFSEPSELQERIRESRILHRRMAVTVAEVFRNGGAHVEVPEGAFYIYPDFTELSPALNSRGINTSTELAHELLASEGIATLPGTAFGDDLERLTLRVAITKLYGNEDEQRTACLTSPAPETLPWVAEKLQAIKSGLANLTN